MGRVYEIHGWVIWLCQVHNLYNVQGARKGAHARMRFVEKIRQ
jgi:hypothetical protein